MEKNGMEKDLIKIMKQNMKLKMVMEKEKNILNMMENQNLKENI